MNKILSLFAAVAVLALGLSASAQQYPVAAFSGGNATGSTIASVIVPAFSAANGTPAVRYLNGTSDKTGSKFSFWTASAPTSANFTNTTTSLPVSSTNGFASSDIIIIQHILNNTYERRVLTTFTSSTNLTVTSAPSTTVVPGDLIYDCTANPVSIIPLGAITNSVANANSGPIFVGNYPGRPVLIDLDGTSAVTLNTVTATYEKYGP